LRSGKSCKTSTARLATPNLEETELEAVTLEDIKKRQYELARMNSAIAEKNRPSEIVVPHRVF